MVSLEPIWMTQRESMVSEFHPSLSLLEPRELGHRWPVHARSRQPDSLWPLRQPECGRSHPPGDGRSQWGGHGRHGSHRSVCRGKMGDKGEEYGLGRRKGEEWQRIGDGHQLLDTICRCNKGVYNIYVLYLKLHTQDWSTREWASGTSHSCATGRSFSSSTTRFSE